MFINTLYVLTIYIYIICLLIVLNQYYIFIDYIKYYLIIRYIKGVYNISDFILCDNNKIVYTNNIQHIFNYSVISTILFMDYYILYSVIFVKV